MYKVVVCGCEGVYVCTTEDIENARSPNFLLLDIYTMLSKKVENDI